MLPKDQFKPVLILFYVIVAVLVWRYFSISVSYDQAADHFMIVFWLGAYRLLGAFLLFGVLPIAIVKFVLRERLADYGLRLGIRFRTVRSFLIASPFIVLIAILTGHNAAFFDVYPLNEVIRPQNVKIGYSIFAVHSILYLGYYFGWEFLFRGFLQHGLSERCGIQTAILIQTLASTMLHYGHPESEIFSSVLAGLGWGILAYRTKSILSGFAQHALLGIVLDATLIYSRQS
jgi:membrane protease YdiL (CAAX protease family)